MQNITALEDFLNDISASKPEGEDLKYSQLYDDVREAQRQDYDLPQGVWVQDLKSADWRQVETLCVEALKKKSKDLQVCAWLVEAWMHLYNLKGLKAGLELMLKLSEKYWEKGYPKLEEGDVEFRLAPYLWLNQKMAERIYSIRATQPNDPELHVHTFSFYIDIQHFIGRKKDDSKSMPKDKLETLESFEKSLEKTETAFFKELVEDANATNDIAAKLEEFLDQKLEKDATSLHNLKNKVGDISRYCKQILSYRGADIDQEDPAAAGEDASQETGEKKSAASEGASQESKPNKGAADLGVDGKNIDITSVIRSRAHAYQIIRESAEFLEELDPHSPAPHLIKRAANWGRLSFADLMRELVQDPTMQNEIRRLLGFQQEGGGQQQSLPPQQGQQRPMPQGGNQPQGQRQPPKSTAPGGWPFDDDFK